MDWDPEGFEYPDEFDEDVEAMEVLQEMEAEMYGAPVPRSPEGQQEPPSVKKKLDFKARANDDVEDSSPKRPASRPAPVPAAEESGAGVDNYFRVPSAAVECVPLNCAGRRLFVRIYPEEDDDDLEDDVVLNAGTLLPVSVDDMIKSIEAEKIQKSVLEEIETVLEGGVSGRDKTLWVDKYAPSKFTELLSDDRTNRQILTWIKEWDPVVFGTPAPKKAQFDDWGRPAVDWDEIMRRKDERQKGKKQRWGNSNDKGGLQTKNDGDKRPFHKVLLIAGPPGLGKTTLAHVLANQAGYNALEINASDDRSKNAMESKLLNALQMKSMFGDARPNLIIIDEIDGAMGGSGDASAIDTLIKIVTADPKRSAKKTGDGDEDEDAGGGAGKKRNAKYGRLNRPIICICNDLYVPALFPLRKIARVFFFKPPKKTRLANRLRYICAKEELQADAATLGLLCTLSENDVRSCLNTLQFISYKHTCLTPQLLDAATIGRKDLTKGLFELWTAVFKRYKPPRRRAPSRVEQDAMEEFGIDVSRKEHTAQPFFQRLYNMVVSGGEHSKIVDGCHQNFLSMNYADPSMRKTVAADDWLGFYDIADRKMRANSYFSLMKYMAWVPVAFHSLCMADILGEIVFPRAAGDARRLRQNNQQFVDGLHSKLPPALLSSVSPQSLILDYFSPIMEIISPSVRPIAVNLMTEREKEDFNHARDVLIDFRLEFVQHDVDGFGSTVLEPPIDKICRFEGSSAMHRVLHHKAQQLLSHEAKLEVFRRKENHHRGVSDTINANASPLVARASLPKAPKEAAPKDFFGRIVERKEGSKGKKRKRGHEELYYAFHEGYTNAVRRTVHMRDLL